jgi:hypothetical protein
MIFNPRPSFLKISNTVSAAGITSYSRPSVVGRNGLRLLTPLGLQVFYFFFPTEFKMQVFIIINNRNNEK